MTFFVVVCYPLCLILIPSPRSFIPSLLVSLFTPFIDHSPPHFLFPVSAVFYSCLPSEFPRFPSISGGPHPHLFVSPPDWGQVMCLLGSLSWEKKLKSLHTLEQRKERFIFPFMVKGWSFLPPHEIHLGVYRPVISTMAALCFSLCAN